jgi:hypothetical protein
MTALREAAQQALAFTMRDFATMRDFEAARTVLHDDLRAALKQEEEASAWLAERKEYWRKEKEKIQATNALRAALAQQAEAVDGACLHGVDDGACKECYAANAEAVEPVATLTAQRDALLEALKVARSIIGHPDDAHSRLIDAAIAAVEEGK